MGGIVRRVMKDVAAGVVHHTGIRKAMSAWRRHSSGGRRINIVSYHRVVADFTGELQRSIPGLLISQETFHRHLEEAHAAGYEFVSLGDALEVMAGRRRATKDLFVVTFDDGYRDVLRYAVPVLKQMGVPAITYLPVGLVGTSRRFDHDRLYHLVNLCRIRRFKPFYGTMLPEAAALLEPILSGRLSPSSALDDFIAVHPSAVLGRVIDALEEQLGKGSEVTPEQGDVMSWEDVRGMARDGFDFGAHTVGHSVLTLEPAEVVDLEVRTSKETIEREIGRPVRDFAYCNGWYSEEVISSLVKHGFRSAVTTEDLPNSINGDPFSLKRKVLWENFSQGIAGYSSALTACHLDDVFGVLGMSHPVMGKRSQVQQLIPATEGR